MSRFSFRLTIIAAASKAGVRSSVIPSFAVAVKLNIIGDVVKGKRNELTGRLQQRYGYAKDQAEKEIDSWLKDVA